MPDRPVYLIESESEYLYAVRLYSQECAEKETNIVEDDLSFCDDTNKLKRKLNDSESSISCENDSNYHKRKFDESVIPRRIYDHQILPLEWWERDPECRLAKQQHTTKIDEICDGDRERVILLTTLRDEDVVLEENMFPYATPSCISHYTLWSIRTMQHHDIVQWVDEWLAKNLPHVKRWQYDDNLGDISINLFHVHIFIETEPLKFSPEPGKEYLPPHLRYVQ